MNLKKELNKLQDKKQAEVLKRFFKTGRGEYGEGDVFLGIKVPVQRVVAKKYTELSHKDVEVLLKSNIHEYRLVALVILMEQYKRSDIKGKERIFKLYLKNYKNVNNWDLVDISAPSIIGDYLLHRPKKILYNFARSRHLWKKRIAIISTLTCIRNNAFDDTCRLAEILLDDEHDLIHKAVGWMLREVGKRDFKKEEEFLRKHYKNMPRTALRYAIERFPEALRKKYLKGQI
ncbi:MAG: DNA alkylation repair protein [Patescibacteria group bacterium]